MRGHGLGEALVVALIETAQSLGYAEIILDVGDYQRPARALYARCGFKETLPKDHISYPGVVFMAYVLCPGCFARLLWPRGPFRVSAALTSQHQSAQSISFVRVSSSDKFNGLGQLSVKLAHMLASSRTANIR